MSDVPDPRLVGHIVERLHPILHGHDPAIQSAALADCVATYLAGFQAAPGPELDALREEFLQLFIDTVRKLIPHNEAMIRERVAQARRGLS